MATKGQILEIVDDETENILAIV